MNEYNEHTPFPDPTPEEDPKKPNSEPTPEKQEPMEPEGVPMPEQAVPKEPIPEIVPPAHSTEIAPPSANDTAEQPVWSENTVPLAVTPDPLTPAPDGSVAEDGAIPSTPEAPDNNTTPNDAGSHSTPEPSPDAPQSTPEEPHSAAPAAPADSVKPSDSEGSAEGGNAPRTYHWDYASQKAQDRYASTERRQSGILTYTITVTIAFLLTFAILIGTLMIGSNRSNPAGGGGTVISGETINGTAVYETVAPSTVTLTVRGTTGSGIGTGFLMSSDGLILTNYHVVDDATSISVHLFDGTTLDATIVGYSRRNDLAVLKIDAQGLTPVQIADSDLLAIGEPIFALGTPASTAYSWTLTDGIISGLDRTVSLYDNRGYYVAPMEVIQMTASVNPGNSGGPLVNAAGQVVGVVSMKLSTEYESIGFAIPINDAVDIYDDIVAVKREGDVYNYDEDLFWSEISDGESESESGSAGGIFRNGYSESEWNDMGFVITPVHATGAFVLTTAEGYDVATKLQPGDIILSANGVVTPTTEEFKAILSDLGAGATVSVSYCRGTETFTTDILIGTSEEDGSPVIGVTVIDVTEGECFAIDWVELAVIAVTYRDGLYYFETATE